MSYLKPQVSFSVNFASLFNVMRDNSSVLSWLKLFTKGAHQRTTFLENFNCSGEFHPIGTLVGSFCWKYKQFQLKKVQRSYASWYWRLMQDLIKSQFVVSKLTTIWWILIRALKSLQICTLIGPFCAKYIIFDLKKYWWVIFHDREESCKIWRKTFMRFGKRHEDFGKFSREH